MEFLKAPLGLLICWSMLANGPRLRRKLLFRFSAPGARFTPSPEDSQLGMGWQIATLSLLRLQNLRCFGLRNCREVSISLVRLALASCREVSLSNARICQDPSSPFHHMTRKEEHSTLSSVPLDRLTLDTYACFFRWFHPGPASGPLSQNPNLAASGQKVSGVDCVDTEVAE